MVSYKPKSAWEGLARRQKSWENLLRSPSAHTLQQRIRESTKVQGTKYVLGFFFIFEAAIFPQGLLRQRTPEIFCLPASPSYAAFYQGKCRSPVMV
jgi:hypothetical protein